MRIMHQTSKNNFKINVHDTLLWILSEENDPVDLHDLRYQPPFRTVCARIAVALVVFIKTPINHIFFKSLIIPDYGFELTKTIYLNVFRNWNTLCKSKRLYINHVPLPPEINGRKQLTPHSLLNTFH